MANNTSVLWHQPEKTFRSKDTKEDLQARRDNLAHLKEQHGIA